MDGVAGDADERERQIGQKMDAGAVEEFAVEEIKNFGGIFEADMLPNLTILSLPVSLIILVDSHWIGLVKQNILNIFSINIYCFSKLSGYFI